VAMAYVLTDHVERRMAERGIPEAWVVRTLEQPDRTWRDTFDDELARAVKRSEDFGDQTIHVVYNDQGEPWLVVTVYPL